MVGVTGSNPVRPTFFCRIMNWLPVCCAVFFLRATEGLPMLRLKSQIAINQIDKLIKLVIYDGKLLSMGHDVNDMLVLSPDHIKVFITLLIDL